MQSTGSISLFTACYFCFYLFRSKRSCWFTHSVLGVKRFLIAYKRDCLLASPTFVWPTCEASRPCEGSRSIEGRVLKLWVTCIARYWYARKARPLRAYQYHKRNGYCFYFLIKKSQFFTFNLLLLGTGAKRLRAYQARKYQQVGWPVTCVPYLYPSNNSFVPYKRIVDPSHKFALVAKANSAMQLICKKNLLMIWILPRIARHSLTLWPSKLYSP